MQQSGKKRIRKSSSTVETWNKKKGKHNFRQLIFRKSPNYSKRKKNSRAEKYRRKSNRIKWIRNSILSRRGIEQYRLFATSQHVTRSTINNFCFHVRARFVSVCLSDSFLVAFSLYLSLTIWKLCLPFARQIKLNTIQNKNKRDAIERKKSHGKHPQTPTRQKYEAWQRSRQHIRSTRDKKKKREWNFCTTIEWCGT